MRRFRDEKKELEDDADDVPLHHKRPFGAGIKRKKIEFVRAQDPDIGSLTATTKPDFSIGDLYASVVLKDSGAKGKASETAATEAKEDEPSVCPVCSLPVTDSTQSHEASLAHQVCLTHSHPPSALDRSRMGLRALEAQGWNPDARQGLGREGEGVRYPVKVVAKDDTLGVGATVPEGLPRKEEKPKKLNRKEMRQLAEKEKQRNLKLQSDIFGSVDVERYLRGGDNGG